MAKRGPSEAKQIRAHLLEVFAFLTRSKPVATFAKGLYHSCSIAEKQLSTASTEDWTLSMTPWSFDVDPKFRRGQHDCTQIVMGAVVEAAAGALRFQSIPINIVVGRGCFSHDSPWCKRATQADAPVATRRLHFDYDSKVTGWPKQHMQIGGNPKELRSAGSYHYAVAEDPSEPRIPGPSLDLVLVLDLVMREFKTGLALPQEPEWRKLVLESETLLLKPYFEIASGYLNKTGRDPLVEHLSRQ